MLAGTRPRDLPRRTAHPRPGTRVSSSLVRDGGTTAAVKSCSRRLTGEITADLFCNQRRPRTWVYISPLRVGPFQAVIDDLNLRPFFNGNLDSTAGPLVLSASGNGGSRSTRVRVASWVIFPKVPRGTSSPGRSHGNRSSAGRAAATRAAWAAATEPSRLIRLAELRPGASRKSARLDFAPLAPYGEAAQSAAAGAASSSSKHIPGRSPPCARGSL